MHSEIGQDYIASAIFRAFRTYKKSVEIKDDIIIENSEMIEDTSIKTEKITDKKDIIEKTNVKLLYKVQIGTYLKSMLNDQNFIDLKAEEHKINGTYRYYISSDNNKSNADTLKDRLRELGFNGAFIVAFLDGKQISTKEALTLQNKLYINE